MQLFDKKYSKNSNIVKYYYNLKITFLFEYMVTLYFDSHYRRSTICK